jgi:hypothetical protein
VVLVVGFTEMVFPVANGVPPHDPVYQFHAAPVANEPPLILKFVLFPRHIFEVPVIELAVIEVSFVTVTMTFLQIVVLQVPSALT